jgi:hypothetical protein
MPTQLAQRQWMEHFQERHKMRAVADPFFPHHDENHRTPRMSTGGPGEKLMLRRPPKPGDEGYQGGNDSELNWTDNSSDSDSVGPGHNPVNMGRQVHFGPALRKIMRDYAIPHVLAGVLPSLVDVHVDLHTQTIPARGTAIVFDVVDRAQCNVCAQDEFGDMGTTKDQRASQNMDPSTMDAHLDASGKSARHDRKLQAYYDRTGQHADEYPYDEETSELSGGTKSSSSRSL